jgi:hypothetical protein
VSIVEVAFACDTSNHHGLHEHESRPSEPDRKSQTLEMRTNSSEHILVQNEEWLDCLNLAVMVSDGEIPVIEFWMDGVLNYFVVPVILVLRPKCTSPMRAIS